MNKIARCVLVQDYSPEKFEERINKEIAGLQEEGFDVEVQFDAEKGVSALLVARKPGVKAR